VSIAPAAKLSIFVRSLIFNVAFYAVLIAFLLAALPTFLLPSAVIMKVCRWWSRTNLWLLRVICNINVEFRGLEKIPHGAVVAASKHQSLWETFALMDMFPGFVYILKRELQWIPLFGWYTIKARMIPVNRGAGGSAMAGITARAKIACDEGRQILIFPEGTRRPVGAEPRYKFGVAQIYAACGVPCVPVALNSGLFWPRRTFLRFPGTVRVEVLDPIAPGLSREDMLARVVEVVETASARLVETGREELRAAGIEAAPPPASAARATT
jgi:1-acyl-sn-glycerol-3-phosphate acyltransferase